MKTPGSERWFVIGDGNGTAHVIPMNDLIQHDFNKECVCCPAAELVDTFDSSDVSGTVYTHHSLDGRELNEV